MKPGSFSRLGWGWLFLAGIVLVGTISYITPDSGTLDQQMPSGRYLLHLEQMDTQTSIRGAVYFEYTGQQEGLLATRIFKLQFVNSELGEGPGLGFLVPLSESGAEIQPKSYRVDPEQKGFMNGFEKVFGYADLKGETPSLFFTRSGKLEILRADPGLVSGRLEMDLDDGHGHILRLKGSFKAQPLPSSLSL